MNTYPSPESRRGFCRVELLAIIISCSLLALIVLPVLAAINPRADRVQCLNQLRRIGQGFQSWANDHADKFPWNIMTPYGGGSEIKVTELFRTVSNEFVSPKLLVCPSDGNRSKTTSWDSFGQYNLSYFAGLHADLSLGRTWLAGDRNLSGITEICHLTQYDGTLISNTTNSLWNTILHNQAGNILQSDGSTVAFSNLDATNYVQAALKEDPEGIFHVAVPQP